MNTKDGNREGDIESSHRKLTDAGSRTVKQVWKDRPKPFLDHLDEFRGMLIRCLVVFAAGVGAAIPLAPWIFRVLRAPLSGVTDHPDLFLRSIEITGGFSILMQIVLWAGLIFGAPFFFFFGARFVFPGLTARERKAMLACLIVASALFTLGVLLGYFVALPLALQVMLRIHDWLSIRVEWTINSYVAFSMRLLLVFGLSFELPVVIMALGYVGLVSSLQLRSKRRHAIVIILIASAILTPADIFSQLAMGIPMLFLYELCVWTVLMFERRRA